MNHSTLDDNPIYRDPTYKKIVYAPHSELTGLESFKYEQLYNLQVKLLSKTEDAFVHIAKDLRAITQGVITVEAGPTVTGPLYQSDPTTSKLLAKVPVDTLYLTRYKGPIDPEALGPRFSSVADIGINYECVSSNSELSSDNQSIWTFEQWNRKI
ncbi:hypothetical protein FGO68_gene13043 [Halteria grandinella]|uniref:Uncharacterized protein n=1 Tax=Halteria grandinella TaxID=5974 RepID=A0A8J8NM27_HALGN|nr:hypothetical protein FGO68_gene13043 [Halteria grandinella]